MNLLEREFCQNSSWLRAQAAAQVTRTIASEANGPQIPVDYFGLSYIGTNGNMNLPYFDFNHVLG